MIKRRRARPGKEKRVRGNDAIKEIRSVPPKPVLPKREKAIEVREFRPGFRRWHMVAHKYHYCDLCRTHIKPGEIYCIERGFDGCNYYRVLYHDYCVNMIEDYTNLFRSDNWKSVGVESWVRSKMCQYCREIDNCPYPMNIFECDIIQIEFGKGMLPVNDTKEGESKQDD